MGCTFTLLSNYLRIIWKSSKRKSQQFFFFSFEVHNVQRSIVKNLEYCYLLNYKLLLLRENYCAYDMIFYADSTIIEVCGMMDYNHYFIRS